MARSIKRVSGSGLLLVCGKMVSLKRRGPIATHNPRLQFFPAGGIISGMPLESQRPTLNKEIQPDNLLLSLRMR